MTRAPTHVLFDLDGTLADTAPDLQHALNLVLAEQGRPPLPLGQVRPAASHGAMAMLRLAWPDAGEETLLPLRSRFIDQYRANLDRQTTLFPGTLNLLAGLEARGIVWGIVTNKLADLTEPLLHALGLLQRAACVVSGDTTAHAKPHPEPLLHACEILGCDPADAIYVGDSLKDVEAARRAGMRVVVAGYGYMDGADAVNQWAPDHVIDEPTELLDWAGLGAGNT
jgi:phosphoglycolate phosphatase